MEKTGYFGAAFPEIYSVLRSLVDNTNTRINDGLESELYKQALSTEIESLQKLKALFDSYLDEETAKVFKDVLNEYIESEETVCCELCDKYFLEGFRTAGKMMLEILK